MRLIQITSSWISNWTDTLLTKTKKQGVIYLLIEYHDIFARHRMDLRRIRSLKWNAQRKMLKLFCATTQQCRSTWKKKLNWWIRPNAQKQGKRIAICKTCQPEVCQWEARRKTMSTCGRSKNEQCHGSWVHKKITRWALGQLQQNTLGAKSFSVNLTSPKQLTDCKGAMVVSGNA